MVDVDVRLPTLEELARRWNEVEELLKPATNRALPWEPIDILRAVFKGDMSLWFMEVDGKLVATATSNLRQHPRMKILEVWFIGGTCLSEWMEPFRDKLDEMARKTGCGAIQGFGRKGWQRFGFHADGVVMTRFVES